jgi:hypothetical protein
MEDLADVWPEGGHFAFSAMDGEARRREPFVLAGLKDTFGWDAMLEPRVTLQVFAGLTPLTQWRSPGDFCFADCWRCTVRAGDDEGIVAGAFVSSASIGLLISFKQISSEAFPDVAASPGGDPSAEIEIVKGNGWYLAICRDAESLKRRFGIGISYTSEAEAAERARHACVADLSECAQRRLAFYRSLPVPDSVSGNMRRAYYRAASVHKMNYGPRFSCASLPMPMPHRRMSICNAAFHALGLQHMSIEFAQQVIKDALADQRQNGYVPNINEPDAAEEQAQPPLLAWSVCRQSERVAHPEFLSQIYPALVKYLTWFENNRKNRNGLYGWRRDARNRFLESGMDNSPRFDDIGQGEITSIDLCAYMASEFYSMEKLARCLNRSDDMAMWQKCRGEIVDGVNSLLWDDETRFYYDLDADGEMVPVKTTAGLLPLLGQIPDRDRAEALRMHLMNPNEFWSGLPVPSVSQDEACYCNDMWRGATWMNINTLLYYGLMTYGFFQEARQLARVSVQEIARCYMKYGCFYDCYDPAAIQSPAEMPRMGISPSQNPGAVQDVLWSASAYVYLTNEMN